MGPESSPDESRIWKRQGRILGPIPTAKFDNHFLKINDKSFWTFQTVRVLIRSAMSSRRDPEGLARGATRLELATRCPSYPIPKDRRRRSLSIRAYLKVSPAALLLLGLVCVVEEGPPRPVEDEPPLVPVVELAAEFVQETATGSDVYRHVLAEVYLVSRRFDVLSQVQRLAPDRQVTRERPLLETVTFN